MDDDNGSDVLRIAEKDGSVSFAVARLNVDVSGAIGDPIGDKSIGIAFWLDSAVAGKVASSSFVVCIVESSVLVGEARSAADGDDDTSFIFFALEPLWSSSKSTSSSYSLMVG